MHSHFAFAAFASKNLTTIGSLNGTEQNHHGFMGMALHAAMRYHDGNGSAVYSVVSLTIVMVLVLVVSLMLYRSYKGEECKENNVAAMQWSTTPARPAASSAPHIPSSVGYDVPSSATMARGMMMANMPSGTVVDQYMTRPGSTAGSNHSDGKFMDGPQDFKRNPYVPSMQHLSSMQPLPSSRPTTCRPVPSAAALARLPASPQRSVSNNVRKLMFVYDGSPRSAASWTRSANTPERRLATPNATPGTPAIRKSSFISPAHASADKTEARSSSTAAGAKAWPRSIPEMCLEQSSVANPARGTLLSNNKVLQTWPRTPLTPTTPLVPSSPMPMAPSRTMCHMICTPECGNSPRKRETIDLSNVDGQQNTMCHMICTPECGNSPRKRGTIDLSNVDGQQLVRFSTESAVPLDGTIPLRTSFYGTM